MITSTDATCPGLTWTGERGKRKKKKEKRKKKHQTYIIIINVHEEFGQNVPLAHFSAKCQFLCLFVQRKTHANVWLCDAGMLFPGYPLHEV